jgi:hypothetical protein
VVSRRSELWALAAIVLIALALRLWGIKADLPYVPHVDEPVFVVPAVEMATNASANPGWFGHPGSTVIYPLALAFRAGSFLANGGPLLGPNPGVLAAFKEQPGAFYLSGRLLSVLYAVLSLPLVFLIGRRVFNVRVALIGTAFAALSPVTVAYAQIVRTDSAGTFFAMLALYLCLRVLDAPSLRNQVLAGAVIGIGVATRYFLALIAVVLVAVDAILLWQQWRQRAVLRRHLGAAVAGLAAIGLAFAVATPYFFLDHETAMRNLAFEARSTHPGADGLSPVGNFAWYLSEALPSVLGMPIAACAAFGAALALCRRHIPELIVVGFVLIYLVAISLPALHWARWLIQIVPLCSLLAASVVDAVAMRLSAWLGAGPLQRWVPIGVLTAALCAAPAHDVAIMSMSAIQPSTRIQAREWIIQNLPQGTRIAQEWYAAPLVGTGFVVEERFSLAERSSVEAYIGEGYRYVVASSAIYNRYYSEPGRYPDRIAFYDDLFKRGRLLRRWEPSRTRGGPEISIYELAPP